MQKFTAGVSKQSNAVHFRQHDTRISRWQPQEWSVKNFFYKIKTKNASTVSNDNKQQFFFFIKDTCTSVYQLPSRTQASRTE